MTSRNLKLHTPKWDIGRFVLLQVGIMLLAISRESFWIDEFWNAYFASLESVEQLYAGLSAPYGSQTPLHFIYGYFWVKFFPASEVGFRLSNLPLFVMGQASLFWALRPYPRAFVYWFLALCALHPMIWQYANELRPYIMIHAGAQMILAYILHLHAVIENDARVSPLASVIFVAGSILLFGASLLGVFWVAAAFVYVTYLHCRHLDWSYLKGRSILCLGCVFLVIIGLLTLYYVRSLLLGGGASRLASTTAATLLFDVYELLGLSGLGPGRLELRETGLATLGPYWIWLVAACTVILAALARGFLEAKSLLGARNFIPLIALGVAPAAIIILSGFLMHWRVLGRHMIATLPFLNLLFALGLAKLCESKQGHVWPLRSLIAVSFLLVFICSSLSMRFSDRHRKDDYRAAAATAKQELAAGKRVWWAADALGARYYQLPGEFDYMGELTNQHQPYACLDQAGVQAVSGATGACLDKLLAPDVVILSKPETFDQSGAITAYLKRRNYAQAQVLPAFTVWRPAVPK